MPEWLYSLRERILRSIVEVRYGKDGTLDEIVISVRGRCVFHLERMDDQDWWAGLYGDNASYHLNFGVRKGQMILQRDD